MQILIQNVGGNVAIEGWHWNSKSKKMQAYVCEAGLSVNKIAQLLPAGVYTTLRTYQGDKVLCLQSHFRRLDESAKLCQLSYRVDEIVLRNIMRIAINSQTLHQDIKIRIHVDLSDTPGDIYIFTEPLIPPARDEQNNGARALTQQMWRENPGAKSTGFIMTADKVREHTPAGINEILMVGQAGEILEGLSSNFFAVTQQTVWTAGSGVLPGITRDLVLESITMLGIPLVLKPYPLHRRDELQEAFISSTSRGVLPLRTIDMKNVGQKCPGDISKDIRVEFERLVNKKLESV